jgi:nucleotide-binding universal stress UspA family protein
MNPFKIILVPTDFGDSAELALDHAIALAAASRARIVLLYVCPLPQVAAYDGAIVPNGDVMEAIRDAGRRGLAQSIARVKDRDVEVRPMTSAGDPRSCILDVAREVSADLIVMGTHGRRGIARWLMGSTAEAVVRTSPIPVLTVRADAAPSKGAAPSAKSSS